MSEKKQEKKVAYEVAEQEFESFAYAWRLDIDTETMTGEDAEDFETSKRKIVRQIVMGNAAVNEEGNIIYKLFEPVGTLEEITMTRPRGRAWLNMDRSKADKNVTKFTEVICSGIGQIQTIVARMDGIDVKFLHAVYGLFLGS